MIEIVQFGYGADNLGCLLRGGAKAIAVDPGDPDFIVKFLEKEGAKLELIVNTHSHGDHTTGNGNLRAATGAEIASLAGVDHLTVGGERVEVIPTPGHTEDSICLGIPGSVITGDTLFTANVGNCRPDLLKTFRASLDTLLSLPDETVVYPGHDYTERSVRRAMEIEKENREIKDFWNSYSPPPVSTTIGTEKKINPYLRTDEPEVIEYLERHGKKVGTTEERFKSFLELC